MNIQKSLWKIYQAEIKKISAKLKIKISESSNQIHVHIQSTSIQELVDTKTEIQKILRCTIFDNPSKHLLWSPYGRKRLQTLSENYPNLHWGNGSTVWMYGSQDQQKALENQLTALINELKTLKTESIVLHPKFRQSVKVQVYLE